MESCHLWQDHCLQSVVFSSLIMVCRDGLSVTLATVDGGTQILIVAKPFRMEVREHGQMSMSVNSLGLLYFEHLRKNSQSEE